MSHVISAFGNCDDVEMARRLEVTDVFVSGRFKSGWRSPRGCAVRLVHSVGAGTDSMQVMMPMHRQMTANMLSAMNREMRDMNMTVDSAWSATVDSVRQDLVRLPELSGSELRAFMPAHRERVNRLMEMHRSMMADMKM